MSLKCTVYYFRKTEAVLDNIIKITCNSFQHGRWWQGIIYYFICGVFKWAHETFTVKEAFRIETLNSSKPIDFFINKQRIEEFRKDNVFVLFSECSIWKSCNGFLLNCQINSWNRLLQQSIYLKYAIKNERIN